MGAARSKRDQRRPTVSFLRPVRKGQETLTRPGGHGGAPRSFPRRRGQGGAARRTTLSPERGGTPSLARRTATRASVTGMLTSELQGVDIRAALDQEKGSVSRLRTGRVPASIQRRQRGSRSAAFFSSSPQILARVSSSSPLVQSKGAMQGLSGELGGAAGVK
jgi:hypothetical protein